VWQVGNSEQIQILKDKWLPHIVAHQDLILGGGSNNDAQVAELID
jgi:hypothetical protein